MDNSLYENDAVELCERGTTLAINDDIEEAINCFDKAIEINPNYYKAYYNRALALGIKGESDNAIKNYTKTIELNPQYAFAYNNRGNLYSNKLEFKKALDDYTNAIKYSTDKPFQSHLYYNRGSLFRDMNDCLNVICVSLDNIDNLGDIRTEYLLGRAIADFNEAIEINPENNLALFGRGQAYYENGENEKALKDLELLLTFDTVDCNIKRAIYLIKTIKENNNSAA